MALRPMEPVEVWIGAMGYTDLIIRHLTDDQPAVLASMARLADVRKALA